MKKANGWLITYLGLIAMVMLVGLVAVWLGGCATVPNTVVIRDSGTSSRQLLTHNRQDPGVGVFVQTGNALLEIEIYKDTEVREKNGKKERRSKQVAAVILQPASMGRSLEYRYGRAVWVSEQWLNVDDDPADNVYNGVYVGWLERFEISDYEGSPKYEFQFDLNKLKD